MLDDHFYAEDIAMFLNEIAKAEAGEPNAVIGNHEVWVRMSADRVIIENMLYGDDRTNDTLPEGTVVKNAATARVLKMLGNEGTAKRPSAKELLETLDEDTLTQLLALLAETKKGDAPAS